MMAKKGLYIRLLLLGGIVFFGLLACSTRSTNDSVNHVVLVWFKQGTTQAEIDEIIQETNKLPRLISQIKSIRLGQAIPSDREIVDDSFDLGIYFVFASQQDMQNYLNHPKHIAFVNQFVKPRLEKLRVYNF